MTFASRLERQMHAPRFDQHAVSASTLVLWGGRGTPIVSNTAYLARLMGVQVIVVDDNTEIAPGELEWLGLDAAPEVMRLDVSRSLAESLLPGIGASGVVTIVADATSFTSDPGLLSQKIPTVWVGPSRDGCRVAQDFSTARHEAVVECGIDGATCDLIAAFLVLHHVARTGAYSDEQSRFPRWDGIPRTLSWPSLAATKCALRKRPARAMLIGAGGLGGAITRALASTPAASELVRSGEFVVVDDDVWDETNFNRVLTATRAEMHVAKATTTAAYARVRLPDTRVSAEVSTFLPSMLERYEPDIVLAATDSLASRKEIIEAATELRHFALVVYCGADFDFGCARAHVPADAGPGALCFTHGPEAIHVDDKEEDERPAAGCTRVGRPSNVLTNVLVAGAVIDLIVDWATRGVTPKRQILVDWMRPERIVSGPTFTQEGCACGVAVNYEFVRRLEGPSPLPFWREG